MIYVAVFLNINKSAFFENPFVYGAKKLENVECRCVQKIFYNKANYFGFNDTSFYPIIVETQIKEYTPIDTVMFDKLLIKANETKETQKN